MTIWEYNAYCEGYKLKQVDDLALQIQAAYYNAYWSGFGKHKKSLQSVLKQLYKSAPKKSELKPIDVKSVEDDFRHMEEIKKNGWYKI